MILPLVSLFACSLGGNTPPRFQSFNGREAKYLFGIAYLENPWQAEYVQSGQRWEFTLGVKDANGDSIEILFPSAPGELNFDSETMKGYWDVPDEPMDAFTELQVLAVDEHGASDILLVGLELELNGEDTGYFEDDYRPKFYGDLHVENNVDGTITYWDPNTDCRILWENVRGEEIQPCPECEQSWRILLTRGTTESPLTECHEAQTLIESIRYELGFAKESSHNEMYFTDSIWYNHPTSGWSPYGTATLAQNRLTFTLNAD